ncbi:SUN domain-containing protein 1-like [Malania oleifera]|uniref:SUN domain-containing protein 1-like n=1 Tax=Malania oleifera TaxID=397392 RepID=UPI0025ADF1BE|nr:SUN domain-containing protein 1-like [Malania oleifera]
MSASTVSITANPAARRRPVVAGEKKSGIELVTNEAAVPQVNGGGDDGVSGGKDLSHSIRGEVVLERSKEVVQVRKGLASSTLSPRRNRKVLTKPEKPRWHTVLSVFTKNFLLLLVLVGLVQMIRKLALKSADSSAGVPMGVGVSDFEGRIAEVEGFMKTTTKMMQVQVEVVDRKIENEVGGLRRELNKKIEEKSAELASEVKRLEAESEGLAKAVGELRVMDLLTKEDLERFYDELKDAKGSEVRDSDMSLDDIRAAAKEIIEKEIGRHAADGLGMVDYALASGGAAVVKHSEPYITRKGSGWFNMANPNGVHNDANRILKPSFGEPGQCFPLKGSSGFVVIRLRTAIVPEAITLEHVAKSVAYDRSSAPKDCRVSGWLQGRDTELSREKMYLLAEFSYDLEKSNAQTFNVLDSAGTGIVDMVRFDFTSNHGSPSHTCIYRLRVHGHEPDSVSMMAMQS